MGVIPESRLRLPDRGKITLVRFTMQSSREVFVAANEPVKDRTAIDVAAADGHA
jgi:hypothetical protein